MLLISGLDTTIVGHYDYAETGFYAVAASATNFMLLIVGSLMAPLMPAASSAGTTSIRRRNGQHRRQDKPLRRTVRAFDRAPAAGLWLPRASPVDGQTPMRSGRCRICGFLLLPTSSATSPTLIS